MAYASLAELFDSFKDLRVLIVGDVMVDAYLWGRVDRISPEAPVPVISARRREQRLGGAANVA
ncbi:MAG: D-glycero-beta-D-manno-heptose-7-phosphate kinase, partial [Catalinimonas sp.]